jgi:hypothetical protein
VEAVRLDPESGALSDPLRIEAPIVCLAAGVLETPALLLRSGLEGDGRVGRDLQFHSSVHLAARFPEPVHGYYGPTMAYAVSEFADVNGRRGPGFMLENVTTDPITTASSLPGFGGSHAGAMEALPYLARALVVLRDQTRGRITLDDSGAPRLHYAPVSADLARLRRGVVELAGAYLETGALEVHVPVNGSAPVRGAADLAALADAEFDPRSISLLYAVHLFGGAAMAGSRSAGVCDESGRVFGARGLYVTDASSLPGNTGVNPQITIMANALRIAGGIAAAGGGVR